MAKCYARYIGFAPLVKPASDDGTQAAEYGAGAFIGKLMNVSVTPKNQKAEIYGDDAVAESVNEANGADIALETTALPINTGAMMFGYTVKGEEGSYEIIDNIDDESKEGLLGYCYCEVVDNVRHYYLVSLPNSKFDLPADTVTTRGNSITFNTPKISGSCVPAPNGEWRHTYEYKSFAEAKAKLKELLKIT